jgi:gamma-glutamylcysteine synthetase
MSSNTSKIPIYSKSSLPIASTNYRRVVQDVRNKQSAIQIKLNDAQNLKTQLNKLAADIETTKDFAQERSEEQSYQRNIISQTGKVEHSTLITKPHERSVIRTPGGTKRKGMLI